MIDKDTMNNMLYHFGQMMALRMVFHFSNANADGSVYDEPIRILQQAKDDIAAGRNPADRVKLVNGRVVEVSSDGAKDTPMFFSDILQ